MAIATLAALGTLASAGTGIYSALSTNNKSNQAAYDLQRANFEDSRGNTSYNKLLNTIGLQRSTAGTQDDQGTTTYYDANTNTWKTKLGAIPAQVQSGADRASIQRNTTDFTQAQLANAEALRAAIAARPGADAARRAIEAFRGQSGTELGDMLAARSTTEINRSNQPIIADMLRAYARTGTAADSQLSALQTGNADSIRKAITEAMINGRTNAGQINAANLAPLTSKYTTLAGATTPALNYSPIAASDKNTALTTLVNDRAKTAGVTPYYGMSGISGAQTAQNTASTGASASVPSSNFGAAQVKSIGDQLGALASNTKLLGTEATGDQVLSNGTILKGTPGTPGLIQKSLNWIKS